MHKFFAVRNLLNPHWVFILIVSGMIAILLLMPDLYTSPYARVEERCVGEVMEVDNSLMQQYGIVKAGSQHLKVRVSKGPHAGREVGANNDLLGKMESDKMFKPGDKALLILSLDNGEIVSATAYDHYRLPLELMLLSLFAVLIIGFAGISGLRALLSFFFAILMIWKIMLPGILTGYDPVWIAFAAVTAISAVTLFLVAGNVKTAMVAWIGSLLGILLTTGMSMLLFQHFRLHGAVLPFSETLLYSGFDSLNLEKLFVAAAFLGASGAVIDVAIDVAAAMYEVAHRRPDLSVKELTKSGFAVGRAMVSTMVTTLLMAYLSGYMALLMVLISKGIPPVQILNLNFVAAEILKTVVGSFGLVTVAPFTAIVGGIMYAKRSQEYEKSESFVISAVQDVQN
ncbi:MAG: YibE/F family protein [Desulfococcaceae bacterium]